MKTFKINDIIKCTSDTKYVVTNRKGTYKVIEKDEYDNKLITIQVIDHENKTYKGHCYTVNIKHFECKEESLNEFNDGEFCFYDL